MATAIGQSDEFAKCFDETVDAGWVELVRVNPLELIEDQKDGALHSDRPTNQPRWPGLLRCPRFDSLMIHFVNDAGGEECARILRPGAHVNRPMLGPVLSGAAECGFLQLWNDAGCE